MTVSREEVRQAVYDGLKVVLNTENITIGDDETFTNYGIDSLDQMNLILELEKRLKISLEDIEMEKTNTIAAIHDFVAMKSGQ
jgi:acyl carrier protein